MDPNVVQDPVFMELLIKHERAARKLRDAVIAMRSFYLKHDKSPSEETTSEKWKGAMLSEEASQRFHDVESAAANLLRYGYELAPINGFAAHLDELQRLRLEHQRRVEMRTGWSKGDRGPRGIEEKVRIDCGPPITLILRPEAYEFTQRAQDRKPARKPTSCQQQQQSSGVDSGEACCEDVDG